MQFNNLISPERARKAARDLYQFCMQNGCLYCPFCIHENDQHFCQLEKRPRDYDITELIRGGGKEHA